MEEIKKEWEKYSPSEKLIAIDAYLDGMAKLDDADEALNNERLEWLRAHLPAYDTKGGKNYIFISYSHLDYKNVYRDLAYFSYNSRRRVRFWYDEGLPVGKDWEAAAGKFMADKHCVGVIFYLSKNLLLSPSVFKEIQAVKKHNKPYFAVALNGGEYFAEKILQKATEEEQLSVQERRKDLADFFPDNNTAITYYEDTAFARINTISRFFDVTEEVFADFEVEEREGWLILKKYHGDKSEIRIPEKIDGKKIYMIGPDFFECKAASVFIPKTVEYIGVNHSYGVQDEKYCDFEEIKVDKDNPKFFDINGVLCYKSGIVLRAPKRWDWKKQFSAADKDTENLIQLLSWVQEYKIKEVGKKPLIDLNEFCAIMSFYFNSGASEMELTDTLASALTEKSSFYKCCLSLREKSLFNGMKKINAGAFSGCSNIDFMFLPNTVKYLEKKAFEKSNLKLICLSENIQKVEDNCFAFCPQLSTVLTDWDKFEECGNKNNIRDAILRGNLIKIEYNCFQNTFIENLVLGENTAFWGDIDKEAFADCYLLKTVTFLNPQNVFPADCKTFERSENIVKVRVNGTKDDWYKIWDRSKCLDVISFSDDVHHKYPDKDIYENPEKILSELGYSAGEVNVPPELKKSTIVCTDGVIPPAEEE